MHTRNFHKIEMEEQVPCDDFLQFKVILFLFNNHLADYRKIFC